jgi:putative hydrolase of HD superfamily
MKEKKKMKRKFNVYKETSNFDDDTLKLYFRFINLKHLFRQGWLKRGVSKDLCESVADHSFGVALLAIDFAKRFFPEMDKQKLIELSLFHEAGEIYGGDITPHDGVSPEKKHVIELQAAKEVFGDLENGDYYLKIWKEFEYQESPEAILIKQLDKFEMGLQAFHYQNEIGLTLNEFIESSDKVIHNKSLKEVFNLVKESINASSSKK